MGIGDAIKTWLSGDEFELTLLFWALAPFVAIGALLKWLFDKARGKS